MLETIQTRIVKDSDDLAALLQGFNEEICKGEQEGRKQILGVAIGTEGKDEGKNLILMDDTATAPLAPTVRVMPSDLSEQEVAEHIAAIEKNEKLRLRENTDWGNFLIGVEGQVKAKIVVLFDPAPAEEKAPPAETGAGPKFDKTLRKVFNRGVPNGKFLQELVAWGKTAPESIFTDQPGNENDVYASVITEIGPFKDIAHRKACLLEVMRVLAGFESSWNWNEGRDTGNAKENSPDTTSAGAFQVSANSMAFGDDLKALVAPEGIHDAKRDGDAFQAHMKAKHPLAMEYIARLMRHTRMHHGPLYKGKERTKFRPELRGEEQSIYPYLRRDAVTEFQQLLTA